MNSHRGSRVPARLCSFPGNSHPGSVCSTPEYLSLKGRRQAALGMHCQNREEMFTGRRRVHQSLPGSAPVSPLRSRILGSSLSPQHDGKVGTKKFPERAGWLARSLSADDFRKPSSEISLLGVRPAGQPGLRAGVWVSVVGLGEPLLSGAGGQGWRQRALECPPAARPRDAPAQ